MATSNLSASLDYVSRGSGDHEVVKIYMLALSACLGLPGLLANLWLIFTIFYSQIIREHTSYVFIVSLAFSDTFSLISRPLMVTASLLIGPDFRSYWITDCGTLWVWFSCQYHFLVIAVNRYCAVIYFDRYQRWFSRRSCYLLVGFCWSLSFLVAMPCLAGEIRYGLLVEKYTYLYTVTYKSTSYFSNFSLSLTVLLLIYCYSGVIFGIHKKSGSLPNNQNFKLQALDDGRSPHPPLPATANGVKKQEASLATQFIIITFIYAMMNMFFFITLGMSAAGINSPVITMTNNTLMTLNFSSNPIVYLIFNKTLRSRMMSVLLFGCQFTSTIKRDVHPASGHRNEEVGPL